ncbi:MAG: hypothetical protein H7Z37_12540 [Pyrinomonadaceae bacterium]|nr:hypothetical protein [Pyrinomonadaceae bacterium]
MNFTNIVLFDVPPPAKSPFITETGLIAVIFLGMAVVGLGIYLLIFYLQKNKK